MDFNIKKTLSKLKIHKDFVSIVIDFGRTGTLGLKTVHLSSVATFQTSLTLDWDMKGGCSTSMPSVLTFGGSGSNPPFTSYFPGPGIAYQQNPNKQFDKDIISL